MAVGILSVSVDLRSGGVLTPTSIRTLSNTVRVLTLAANTAVTVTVPTGATMCLFKMMGNKDFWVDITGGTAATPATAGAVSTVTSILSPVGIVLATIAPYVAITTFSVIGDTGITGNLCMEFFVSFNANTSTP